MKNNNCNIVLPLQVPDGGTGLTTGFPLCELIVAGSTSTGAFQTIPGIGGSSIPLVTQGPGKLPVYMPIQSLEPEYVSSGIGWYNNLQFNASGSNGRFLFVLKNVVPVDDGASLCMQMSIDSGSTWVSSGYTCDTNRAAYNSTTWSNSNTTSCFYQSGALDNASGYGLSGVIYLSMWNSAMGFPSLSNPMLWGQTTETSEGIPYMALSSGTSSSNIAGTYLPYYFNWFTNGSTGNLISGTIYLFILKN